MIYYEEGPGERRGLFSGVQGGVVIIIIIIIIILYSIIIIIIIIIVLVIDIVIITTIITTLANAGAFSRESSATMHQESAPGSEQNRGESGSGQVQTWV